MNKVEINNGTLWVGNSSEVLKQYPDNHFDSVITDAPYGIEFLGKDWDNNTGAIEVWQECLRVLKPGGYLLSFGAPRTYHRLATNLEDVGFEIKDSLMWLFGSGFPKSHNVGNAIDKKHGAGNRGHAISSGNKFHPTTGKARPNGEKLDKYEARTQEGKGWEGWGTALKPAHEPIVMCRKPLDNRMGKRGKTNSRLNVSENVEKWGVGALNIDATRIEFTIEADKNVGGRSKGTTYDNNMFQGDAYKFKSNTKSVLSVANDLGRFPSNVIVSEEVGNDLNEKIGDKKFGNKKGGYKYDKTYNVEGFINNNKPDAPSNYGDGGGPSKYFYSPKVNRKERNVGFEIDKIPTWNPSGGYNSETGEDMRKQLTKDREGISNNHPTIKPVALILYLVKMITPPNGKVLDPFNGSGSTGMAVKQFGGHYVGIDLDENYIEISRKRINAWDK